MARDDLNDRIYELLCPECAHMNHKALGELIVRSKLPCDSCGLSIDVARDYGQARLTEILEGLGRGGSIVPERKKRD